MTESDSFDLALLEVPRPRGRREVTHDCEYQIVWCTKYTRPLLADVLPEAVALLQEAAKAVGAELLELSVQPSVVAIRMRVDPTLGVHRAVRHLKSTSAAAIRARHPSIRSRAPSLWTSKYLVASVGEGAAPYKIRDFLDQQRRG